MAGAGAEAFADVQGRMKALAVAEPLLELDRVQASLRRGWGEYQMVELALAAIDAVALRMDLDGGAAQEEVERIVADFAAVQQPQRPSDEHREVTQWIVHRLVNADSRDRGFDYGVGIVDEGYAVRRFSFRLLRDTQNTEGRAVLEASDEAINVLVHALDVDIASEQVAAEAKLHVLLKKGDIPKARAAAQQASFHSQRFRGIVQAKLEAARRDIRAIDWNRDVAPVTEEALAHLDDRITAERGLLDLVRNLQESPLNDDQRQGLDDLHRLLEGCERAHMELSTLIARAGEEIREQITRQVFAIPQLRPTLHIASQLLDPALQLCLDDAAGPLERFLARAMGPAKPAVFYLPAVLNRLSEVPEEEDSEEVDVEDLDDQPISESAPLYTPAQEALVAEAIAEGATTGARLSALLDQVRDRALATDLPHNTDQLMALRAFQLYANPQDHPDIGAIGAIRDGAALDYPDLGGDDLRLTLLAPPSAAGDLPSQATAPAHDDTKETV